MTQRSGDGTPAWSKESTSHSPSTIRSLSPAILTFCGVALAFVVVAILLGQREASEQRVLFDTEASEAFASIEDEIQSHITVIDDLTAFIDATWPGDIEEWRRYISGRVNAGNDLAFTSTAGFIELVPASELDAVIARERVVDPDFSINEPLPLGPTADRYVLTRSGLGDGLEVRGLEMSAALLLTNVSLPAPGDRLLVQGVDEAPDAVVSALGIEPRELADNNIYGTNIVFVNVVAHEGSGDPIGWVVIPADLGLLLEAVVETLKGDLSIRISVPDAPVRGDVGRYEGAGALAFEDARYQSTGNVTVGGWLWTVDMWSDSGSGAVGAARLTLTFGLAFAALLAAVVENRRRHGRRLLDTRLELSMQRTLAETDHLTGLPNRQGLAALRDQWSENDMQLQQHRGTVLFIDLDGFKAINDELGHAVGDQVLVRVAECIRSVTRQEDVVVRTGGDEFVMVCPGLVDRSVIQSKVDDLGRAFGSDDAPVAVEASVGWAVAERSLADELDDLIAAADEAMYRNKEARRSTSDVST